MGYLFEDLLLVHVPLRRYGSVHLKLTHRNQFYDKRFVAELLYQGHGHVYGTYINTMYALTT